MMRGVLWVLATVFVFSAVLTCWPDDATSQEEILKEWGAKLAAIRTLQLKQLVVVELEMSGMKQRTEMPLSVAFFRPDRLALQSQFVTVVCDGSNVYTRIPMSGKYRVHEQKGRSLAECVQEPAFGLVPMLPDIKAVLSADPYTALRESLQEGPCEVLPDEQLGGKTFRVLVLTWKRVDWPALVKNTFKLWIDKESGLIYRAESLAPSADTPPAESGDEDSQLASMMKNVRFLLETTHVVLNEPLSDTEFAFTPGPQDKKVETTSFRLFGASGGGPGFGRFELSGKPAPDFELTLMNGDQFKLSAHTGSVVLIDFWATWCKPCIHALPEVRKLHELYATNGLVVVGVSRDSPQREEKLRSVVESHSLRYPIGMDAQDSIAAKYFVEGIPCMVLVNREGIIQGRKVGFASGGMETLRKDIESVLAGREIAGARPLSETELKELEEEKLLRKAWHGKSSALDTNVFREVWRVTSTMPRGSWHAKAVVAIPPMFGVVLQGTQLVVLGIADGHTNRVINLSPGVFPASQKPPVYYYLRSPPHGCIAAMQWHYKASGDEEDSHKIDRVELFGMTLSGEVIWTQKLDPTWHSGMVSVLPLTEDSDALLLAGYQHLLILGADGRTLLRQRVDYHDQFMFFRDAEKRLRVLVSRRGSMGLYDFVLAP